MKLLGMQRQALHGRCLLDIDSATEFLSPLPEDFSSFLTASMKLNAEQVEKLVIKADEEEFCQFVGELSCPSIRRITKLFLYD